MEASYSYFAGVKLCQVMKKTISSEGRIEGIKYYSGTVLPQHRVEYLVGRLLTIIDAMGLNEVQEKSVKDLIKNEVYTVTREGWIAPELNQVLHDFIAWGKHIESTSIPHDTLAGEYTLTFRQAE